MPSLAKSPLAPILGQHVPLRGPARLLFRSYAKTSCLPGVSERRLTSKFGDEFNVDLASVLEWRLWAFGSYEEHFAELFSYLVAPGNRCIDVGANVGVHTVRLAKLVGAQGQVIAIEPNEEAARRAVSNLALNRLANARVMHAAATSQAGGYVELYLPGNRDTNRARASLLPHGYLTGSVAKVLTLTVDDVAAGPVALIKIDVEGHEAAVVSGAAETIKQYSPTVIFEYAPYLLSSPSQSPFGWLAGRGYKMLRIQHERNSLTGRGRLVLDHLRELPARECDILAVTAPMLPRVEFLVRLGGARWSREVRGRALPRGKALWEGFQLRRAPLVHSGPEMPFQAQGRQFEEAVGKRSGREARCERSHVHDVDGEITCPETRAIVVASVVMVKRRRGSEDQEMP